MTDTHLDPAHFGNSFKAFMDAVVAAAVPPSSPLLERIVAHLGGEVTHLPVLSEEYNSFDHPNLQVALDEYIGKPGRQSDLVGIGADNKRFMGFGLSDLLSRGHMHGGPPLTEGPVDYVNFHLAAGRVLPCVQFGLYLIHDGDSPLVVLVTGPTDHGPRPKLRIEALATQPEVAQGFLAELTDAMERLNVYRGHVLSLSAGRFGPGPQTMIGFHSLPTVTRDDVILPAGILERIERQTIVFSEQSAVLRAAGRSLKRGMLLYGPPGVGKTLTVQYLIGRMPGRTVLLTVGRGLGMIEPITEIARSLAPSMVVLEDIDLIAEERGMPGGHAGPLLFELLNQMDGLNDDSDIIFVLTTNRPEVLEPALAARPGRIDLAVELPLPDAAGRRRLLDLYARGLELRDVDSDAVAERIEGATPAYIKELLRKATVIAASQGGGAVVTGGEIEAALAELDEGGELAHRLLGFRSVLDENQPTEVLMPPHRAMASGYPATRVARSRPV